MRNDKSIADNIKYVSKDLKKWSFYVLRRAWSKFFIATVYDRNI